MTIALWLVIGAFSAGTSAFLCWVFNTIAAYLNRKCTGTFYMPTTENYKALMLTGILLGPLTLLLTLILIKDVYDIAREL